MRLKLIWYLNCHLFQNNIGVKQSPLTPRHLHLKGRGEIKNKHNFFCKVCQFEGRCDICKGTVFCSNHGLSLYQQINTHPKNKTQIILWTSKIMTSEITEWEWLSPNQDK